MRRKQKKKEHMTDRVVCLWISQYFGSDLHQEGGDVAERRKNKYIKTLKNH